jgi:hypothetical protein
VEVSDKFLVQPDGSIIFIAAFVSLVANMTDFMAAEVKGFEEGVIKNIQSD